MINPGSHLTVRIMLSLYLRITSNTIADRSVSFCLAMLDCMNVPVGHIWKFDLEKSKST